MLGVIQLLRHESWKNRPQLLFLTQSNSRREITPDERYLDVFTDELITAGQLDLPAYVIENPTNWGHLNPTVGPIHLYAEPLLRLRGILTNILKTKRRLMKTAEGLVRILSKTELPLSDEIVFGIVEQRLRKFEAERMIYRFILSHRKVRGFFILDSDSYTGPIAAAKELLIPVFEFQHGQMGQEHIGYQWDHSLVAYKNNMPIPDFIFVYVPFWQSMLTKKGFWKTNEIVPVGTARMDRFIKLREKSSEQTGHRIKVIFTTQWPSREDAIVFWAKVLRKIKKSGEFEIDLVVKIHQFEKQHISTYKVLEEKFPNNCKVIFDEVDTYSLLSKSDVHVSYYSSTLMESIAAGIPSVSICRACCPSGISGSMSMPEVRNFIHHLKNADELVAFLRNTKIGKENKQEPIDIYSEHFVKKTTSFINQLIN